MNPQVQGQSLGNYQPCTHTPLELAKERAEVLRRALERVNEMRVELALMERMIAAAKEPGQ